MQNSYSVKWLLDNIFTLESYRDGINLCVLSLLFPTNYIVTEERLAKLKMYCCCQGHFIYWFEWLQEMIEVGEEPQGKF